MTVQKTRVFHQMWALESATHHARREATFGERIDSATIDGLSITTETL